MSLLTLDGAVTIHSGKAESSHSTINAVDNDRDTNWVELTSTDPTLTPYLTYDLPKNVYYWFDTYGIRATNNATLDQGRNPTKVDFQVKSDFELVELPQLTFAINSDGERMVGRFHDNVRLYNSFTILLTDRFTKTSDTAIADIILEACHKMYCSEDGEFEATNQGEKATANCPPGFTGTQTRVCEINRYPNWENPDTSSCLPDKPSLFSYPSSQYSFFKGELVSTEVKPVFVSAIAVTFTTLPALPDGLRINENTGVIFGTPTKVTDGSEIYVITASNAVGSSTYDLQISVRAYECQSEALWPNTERATYASIDCVNGLIGKRKRFCTDSTTPVWLDPEENECREYRDWTNPFKGEKYIVGTIDLSVNGIRDHFFEDSLIKSIYESVSGLNEQSVLIRVYGNATRENLKYDIQVVTTSDTFDSVSIGLDNAINTGKVSQAMPSKYIVSKIEYKYSGTINHVSTKKVSVLTIALSCVFGVILLVIIGVCVYFRYKRSKMGQRKGVQRLSSNNSANQQMRPVSVGPNGERSIRAGNNPSARVQKSVRL